MSEKKTNRRDFLFTATYAVGAVGVGATIWPMIDQMNPDASVKALASTEVDVSAVNPGKTITVLWRGKPVFIRRRTQDEIAEARSVKLEDLKHPEKDEDRAANPEWLVMLGVCTHLGCVPLDQKGEYNGWFCPCHGSHYDISGRIRKGPAPTLSRGLGDVYKRQVLAMVLIMIHLAELEKDQLQLIWRSLNTNL